MNSVIYFYYNMNRHFKIYEKTYIFTPLKQKNTNYKYKNYFEEFE